MTDDPRARVTAEKVASELMGYSCGRGAHPNDFGNRLVRAFLEFAADAVAQAAKPWQEARRAQVDAMNRLGLLGSPVEELTRMAEEIARLLARVTELEDAARETVRRALGGIVNG